MRFSSLISWYKKNKRDLPWRRTTDPYRIWLSEIILQQTRVDQGMPYYLRYIDKYPDITRLAGAPKDDVFKLWQGLGYYNRAENMLHTARLIADEHKGKFPGSYDELIKLKGIGPYTAAAVASFAYNEAKPVLDGNVYRVLSRIFAITEPIDSAKGKALFYALAEESLDRNDPATHNQAMMELGAMICKPRSPLCEQCPLMLSCEAFAAGIQQELPVKSKKKKPRDRYLNYFFIITKGYTYIYKRSGSGIWKNLYEPPVTESDHISTPGEITSALKKEGWLADVPPPEFFSEPAFAVKHQLTHQTIYASFYIIEEAAPSERLKTDFIRTRMKDIHTYPVHRLFDKFLNYHTLHL